MNPGRANILIVEDDEAITEGLIVNLRLEGFAAFAVHDGEAGLRAAREQLPDLILLDISLPKISGLEVLKTLRAAGDRTPIIVLSAHQDEFDKVAALRLGADDYVTKPFGVAELLARIESVLRRSAPDKERDSERTASPESVEPAIVIDAEKRQVTRHGGTVPLTHLEFELLHFLVQNPGKVFSRRELLRSVWAVQHAGSARTVDNFVAQLRAKLEDDPERPRHLVTVRGSGYRFDP